ncbi:hypothetical protein ZIOFF_006456 [Zingiber officinale]|uniref:ER membrane protein complex subunit 6 n=1 Tax=Zingiber officinale TaxID=94328 RepID=A0A8J5HVL5_ZINOF|nr:hypothetical protein ZIOFF_006456 [Zingiber officinale]
MGRTGVLGRPAACSRGHGSISIRRRLGYLNDVAEGKVVLPDSNAVLIRSGDLRTSAKESEDDLPILNAENLQSNIKSVYYSRTFLSIIGGVVAGIWGFTGLTGFVFYFLVMAVASLGLAAKAKFSVNKYFDSWNRILIDGVFGGLMNTSLLKAAQSGSKHPTDCFKESSLNDAWTREMDKLVKQEGYLECSSWKTFTGCQSFYAIEQSLHFFGMPLIQHHGILWRSATMSIDRDYRRYLIIAASPNKINLKAECPESFVVWGKHWQGGKMTKYKKCVPQLTMAHTVASESAVLHEKEDMRLETCVID